MSFEFMQMIFVALDKKGSVLDCCQSGDVYKVATILVFPIIAVFY